MLYWVNITFEIVGFVVGYSSAISVMLLVENQAYTDAATIFTLKMGIPAAIAALLGRGKWGLMLGFLLGILA